MEKRGISLTIEQVIVFIIILIGLAVILFFITRISWTSEIDKETCYESVTIRATLPSTAGAKSYAPLKCKTDKICITAGSGGKCSKFENAQGVINVKVKSIAEVEKIVATNIVDCWKMMGQGKVSIFSQWLAESYAVKDVYSSCVFCTRIAFDTLNLAKAGIDLRKMDVTRYMQTRQMPETQGTYTDYFGAKEGLFKVKEGLKISDFDPAKVEGQTPVPDDDAIVVTLTQEEINKMVQEADQTKELAIMFMQISAPKHGDVLANDLKLLEIAEVSSFVVSPVSTLKGNGPVGSIVKLCAKHPYAAIACAGLAVVGVAVQQTNVALNRDFAAGKCGDLSMPGNPRDGCSAVRALTYEEEDVRAYCNVVESIS